LKHEISNRVVKKSLNSPILTTIRNSIDRYTHLYYYYYYYYVHIYRYALELWRLEDYIYLGIRRCSLLVSGRAAAVMYTYGDGRSTTGAKPKKRRLDLSAACNNFFKEFGFFFFRRPPKTQGRG